MAILNDMLWVVPSVGIDPLFRDHGDVRDRVHGWFDSEWFDFFAGYHCLYDIGWIGSGVESSLRIPKPLTTKTRLANSF